MVYVPLGLAKYNPRKFFVATLSGKLILCYVIVILSHYVSGPVIDPIFESFGIYSVEDMEDPTLILIGIISFGAAMTAIVLILLRLNWEKILGRVAPWTLDDDDQK